MKTFGLDAVNGRIVFGSLSLPVPKSRTGRIVLGGGLILGGILGFLPILGFWMLPLGVIILSQDLPLLRRMRRRLACWWEKRRRSKLR